MGKDAFVFELLNVKGGIELKYRFLIDLVTHVPNVEDIPVILAHINGRPATKMNQICCIHGIMMVFDETLDTNIRSR
jgi:hypothetical protein